MQRIAEDQGLRSEPLVLGNEAATAVDNLLEGLDENTRGSSREEANNGKRMVSTNDLAVISIPLLIV
jgi:hypothetical protein